MPDKQRAYRYYTSCVNSTYEKITAMTETEREVTYETFINYAGLDSVLELFPTYARSKRDGLTLKEDWAVSYYKSKYDGVPCYYMRHSAIEYIWIDTLSSNMLEKETRNEHDPYCLSPRRRPQ